MMLHIIKEPAAATVYRKDWIRLTKLICRELKNDVERTICKSDIQIHVSVTYMQLLFDTHRQRV
jgi:hypothetical protein